MATRTRTVTLYHLLNLDPTEDGLLGALDIENLDLNRFNLTVPRIPGATAVALTGNYFKGIAEWCRDFTAITGEEAAVPDDKSAGLLLLSIDHDAYAVGFGQGYRLVPDEHKDRSFGRRFAIRAIDPGRVNDLVRHAIGGPSRTDTTQAPAGLHINAIGVSRYADIVNSIGGDLDGVDLALGDGRTVRISGAAGLRLPIPVDAAELVATIRKIAEICASRPPRDGLAFIEDHQPVADPELVDLLDLTLDERLGRRTEESAGLLAPVVPVEYAPLLDETRSYDIQIGSVVLYRRPSLEAVDFLQRAFVQTPGARVRTLRAGRVTMYDGATRLARSSAIRWLEATVSIDARLFSLRDGDWYELGARYHTEIRSLVEELLGGPSSVDLPAWPRNEHGKLLHERDYNQYAETICGMRYFLNLDRTGVRDELHTRNGIEVCDLLGPDDELIAVKPASGSSPLSHQFAQVLVSVQTLINSRTARRNFAALVDRTSGGIRSVSVDYQPKRVIFAILLKHGQELTADTLFPFAQVALVGIVQMLRAQYDITVEVVGIPTEIL